MTTHLNVGNWRYNAIVEQFAGPTHVDDHGNPILDDQTNWLIVIAGWPCEVLSVSGGERIRGRQVTATTTHVMRGEWSGGRLIKPHMRIIVDEIAYNVVSAYDPDGDRMEMRVEAKIES